MGSYSLNV